MSGTIAVKKKIDRENMTTQPESPMQIWVKQIDAVMLEHVVL